MSGQVPEWEHVEVKSRAELRAWLSENHAQTESIWLVHYKKHTAHWLPWEELVQEALCWGWIDGQAKTVDEDRYMHRLSPRRAGSHWSAINKRHADALEAAGLMRDPGRAVIERAKADGSWTWLDDIENLVVPSDLRVELDAAPQARATWDGYPTSEKKQALFKLKSSKRPETRQTWLRRIVDNASAGQKTFD